VWMADRIVVLVDDRSSDRTGELMARAAATHPGRAVALRVEALPPGWLGKPHALWLGSRRAAGSGCCSPTRTSCPLPAACAGPWLTLRRRGSTTSRCGRG
jgi:hypothetical protein